MIPYHVFGKAIGYFIDMLHEVCPTDQPLHAEIVKYRNRFQLISEDSNTKGIFESYSQTWYLGFIQSVYPLKDAITRRDKPFLEEKITELIAEAEDEEAAKTSMQLYTMIIDIMEGDILDAVKIEEVWVQMDKLIRVAELILKKHLAESGAESETSTSAGQPAQ